MIPFIDLASQQARIRERIDHNLATVLDHGAYIMGPEVLAIEARLAEYAGTRHCISCSSGTDALILALLAQGLRPGQGVIVPSFTFAASAEVMPVLGAVPVFAEVDPQTFNLDPARLGDALATARDGGVEIVGIIGVGLFGQPADYTAIGAFAAENGLWVIDDAAQSFGGSWNGTPVGQLAELTCTSFFPAKPLGCYGDGGAVFTDDDEKAEIMRSCRIHGMGRTRYENIRIGMTARLDTMQAAVLDAKLDIFADELTRRQQVAERYAAMLGNLVETPRLAAAATSSWAQYTIKLPEGADRDHIAGVMKAHDVPTAVYYPVPMHEQPPYRHFPVADGGLDVTSDLCARVLALPMHPYLDAPVQEQVAAALATALGDSAAYGKSGAPREIASS
ncbi:MAG: DegT/DnrJ/EryC1/StrS aminotransferase family protein [Alphaproteobacteria bacterium]|jgi:dTDP-4-amino-4,6-dideoxygalactose transaminase|nr:DegT/DnrJ/EryC1/StrS aminotransferase family protein [Alphaproteobacteria bacterium]